MSDITELEDRMEQIEKVLEAIDSKVNKIERGLFGDDQFGHTGIAKRIKKLEDEVSEIKKVNDNQEISIKSRKNLTDNVVVILQRAFWVGAVLLVVLLLLTGKIGFVDLVKGLMD